VPLHLDSHYLLDSQLLTDLGESLSLIIQFLPIGPRLDCTRQRDSEVGIDRPEDCAQGLIISEQCLSSAVVDLIPRDFQPILWLDSERRGKVPSTIDTNRLNVNVLLF